MALSPGANRSTWNGSRRTRGVGQRVSPHQALNVVRRKGSDANELPGILRRWFGPNAGLPGTDFQVVLEQDKRGYILAPLGRTS
jgi:hypothetical protein